MGIVLAGAAVAPAANTLGGEGWRQVGELGLALLLSAAIGLEREIGQKDAGLRTHTLVGVGAAAGAGLPVLAALATGIYAIVALGFPAVTRRLPVSATAVSALRIRYPDGRGLLRRVLREATERGFAIDDVSTETIGPRRGGREANGEPAKVEVTLHVHGKQPVSELAAALSDLDYVDAVLARHVNVIDE